MWLHRFPNVIAGIGVAAQIPPRIGVAAHIPPRIGVAAQIPPEIGRC